MYASAVEAGSTGQWAGHCRPALEEAMFDVVADGHGAVVAESRLQTSGSFFLWRDQSDMGA